MTVSTSFLQFLLLNSKLHRYRRRRLGKVKAGMAESERCAKKEKREGPEYKYRKRQKSHHHHQNTRTSSSQHLLLLLLLLLILHAK